MPAAEAFDQALTDSERRRMKRLKSPAKIQAFLDDLSYSAEKIYRCPLRVLREKVGHCFDAALFAAAALRRIGFPPLILEMLPNKRDDDHLLALFKQDGHWGALANSNFVGLRFREPIHRNLRELVLSYFEQHYNLEREKTLRGYTRPLNLKAFDRHPWMTRDEPLELIAQGLDRQPRFRLLSGRMIAGLSLLDERSFRAGLQDADQAGLYRPAPAARGAGSDRGR